LAGNIDDVDVQQWIKRPKPPFFISIIAIGFHGQVDLMPELQRRVESEEAVKVTMLVEDFGNKAREALLALWTEGPINKAEF
jgi:hypothetical protein